MKYTETWVMSKGRGDDLVWIIIARENEAFVEKNWKSPIKVIVDWGLCSSHQLTQNLGFGIMLHSDWESEVLLG